MSLLFNMLSMLVITFLPRSKCLLISWLQSPSVVILEPKNKVCHCFPIYLPWSDGTRCHDLSFLNVEFLSQLLTLFFHFHQETVYFFFVFCHKGGVICIFEIIDILPEILIPACASSSPVFLMMYSAYKLNKQGDNTQPWHTSFPIWNQSVVPCSILTVASWPTYRFLQCCAAAQWVIRWMYKTVAHSLGLRVENYNESFLVLIFDFS